MAAREGRHGEGRAVVAVFDFDGTLASGDSLLPFLREVAGRRGFWSGMVVCLPWLVLGRLGWMDRGRAKERVLGHFLGGRTVAEVGVAVDRFVRGRLATMMDPRAMQRLAWHRAMGHRVVIASASPEIYLRPWAAGVGVADVVGTRLEVGDGQRLTGRLDGLNCRGEEKLRRLDEWLGGTAVEEAMYVYTDNRSDRPLLGLARWRRYRVFASRGVATVGWAALW